MDNNYNRRLVAYQLKTNGVDNITDYYSRKQLSTGHIYPPLILLLKSSTQTSLLSFQTNQKLTSHGNK